MSVMMSTRALARKMAAETGRSFQACRGEIRRHGSDISKRLKPVQSNCCAICGDGGRLVVDHDHVTGHTRGMLCGKCNTGLGMFKDSQKHLQSAIDYLRNPPALGLPARPTDESGPLADND